MKKLYLKNELDFAFACIVIYIVLFSVADAVSKSIGVVKCVTMPACIAMAGAIYWWINKNGLREKYGLCKTEINLKEYLYFLPMVIILTPNLWNGVKLNYSIAESFLCVITMFGVGFIEEVIFRGFLFTALSEKNLKSAIIISSLTFGIGHIVNLLNGAPLFPTLLQLCYASAIGYLFTILFYRTKNLMPCVISHIIINATSIFAVERNDANRIFTSIVLVVVSVSYGVYLSRKKETRIK